MAKNRNIEEIYNHLLDIDRKRTLTSNKQERERIEDYIRTYVNNCIDDDIFAQMSEGCASGLFAHGHYDFDMEQSLRILKNMSDHKE
jgi:hypothetical protein|uniref:hypothetical protein n=1 Tax=Prevotella sp. TaxID=59823 RepID=UPI003FEFF681